MSKLWDDLKDNMKEWGTAAVEKAEEVSKVAVAKTEELTKIRNEKFKDQPLPTAEQARKLIERVENGEDADAVVTEFYLEKNK